MNGLHFTYAEPVHDELLQGDILKRTPQLEAIMREVHPHYLNREYTHFQVITQSCDLVRRGESGICKTRYITIAAIRSLETVITRELEKIVTSGRAVVIEGEIHCSKEAERDLKDFLNKIYNNQSKDYFFLYSAPSHELESDSCTFLPLSIAVKADLHFDALLSSKCLQLEDNFQSRLGWMVGNLYSRVGTKDFVPTGLPTSKEFNSLISNKLQNHLTWVKKTDFSTYKKNANEPNVSVDIIKKRVAEEKERKISLGISEIIRLIKLEVQLDEVTETKIVNRLSKSGLLISSFTKESSD